MSTVFDPAALGLRAASTSVNTPSDTLTQGDFLTLLITQLKNQDPLSPLDNEAFVAQLAQFSTVSGITSTNDKLDSLAQLTASNVRTGALQWIGRSVEGTDGSGGTVASVSIGDDSSLTLTLDTGATLAAGTVKRMS
ncbi:flagellar basal body rod modification protein [Sandaracinobacter neustonicus]|uniref:Basal-body rod modification protein FlgD n=1 Tax=Sandaracinobacter neustonicus TaxID=1715348 RepID=A0A501XEM0_9SPHN|nr:flagellar hook capping FlgD N-terminal domain-containing protein [Sandaracinobacter neustonicus]TPE59012.1 flagellar basal body rod modification protein [Sandaracinobacter neustonicus]